MTGDSAGSKVERAGPATRVPAAAGTLRGVQYLRGIAAMMVAYLHLTIQVPALQHWLAFRHGIDTANFERGVDVFFVISGFIMVVTARDSTPGAFALRRIIRVVPVYWLLTLVLATLALIAPSLLRTTQLTLPALVESLLFVPFRNSAHGGKFYPLLVPGWTLNFEMFFYGLFAASLFLPARFRLAALGATFVAVLLLGAAVPLDSGAAALDFYASPRILEFWVGMAIATLHLGGHPRWSVGTALVVSALAAAALLIDWRELGIAAASSTATSFIAIAAATALVMAVVALERGGGMRQFRPLGILGDASYSIYLTHVFSLAVLRVLWSGCLPAAASVSAATAFAVLGLATVAAVGVATYQWIERPMLRATQRRIQGSGASRANRN